MLSPAVTVTEVGTVTAAVLLLDKLITSPLLPAAVFRVTVHWSVPDPVIDPLAQLSPLTIGTPVPDRLTFWAGPLEEVLVNVNWPADVPAAVGSNCTLRFAESPGFKVRGNVSPETANPAPLTVAAFTVTADVPVDERISVCVANVPTSTLPKFMLPALRVKMDDTAFNSSAKV